MFFASNGLKGRELAFEGDSLPPDVNSLIDWSFANDYVALASLNGVQADTVINKILPNIK